MCKRLITRARHGLSRRGHKSGGKHKYWLTRKTARVLQGVTQAQNKHHQYRTGVQGEDRLARTKTIQKEHKIYKLRSRTKEKQSKHGEPRNTICPNTQSLGNNKKSP